MMAGSGPLFFVALAVLVLLVLGGPLAIVVFITRSGKKACVACGQTIEGDSRFCRLCGAPQPLPGFPKQPQG